LQALCGRKPVRGAPPSCVPAAPYTSHTKLDPGMSKAKNKNKQKTLASFFFRKNKNTGRQVLQNKGHNRTR
jgi:hypothetical protein